MIRLDNVSYTYPGAADAILHDISLTIEDGERVFVAGPTGAGKSTLLRCLNGLVPHHSGGSFSGSVQVQGFDPLRALPRGMCGTIGVVCQDGWRQSLTTDVTSEITFVLENLGLSPITIERRLDRVLETVGISHLHDQQLSQLSSGERQQVAIAGVLAAQPSVLLLDDATSMLDPATAASLYRRLSALATERGLTLVATESRPERLLPHVDRMLYLPGPGQPPTSVPADDVLSLTEWEWPMARLARALGWPQLPSDIRDAPSLDQPLHHPPITSPKVTNARAEVIVEGLGARSPTGARLEDVSIRIGRGESVAIMGDAGSAGSSLLRYMAGQDVPDRGQVLLGGMDTRDASPAVWSRSIRYLPQDSWDMLVAGTVGGEQALLANPADNVFLASLAQPLIGSRRIATLSAGERQRLALAAVLGSRAGLMVLDEPAIALDAAGRRTLARYIRDQQALGRGAIIASHDPDLVGDCADRVILLSEGRIIADGPTGQVMLDHPEFASQVSLAWRRRDLVSVNDILGNVP